MPPMPRWHPGHPSDDDEDADDEDRTRTDEDDGQNATPPADFADKLGATSRIFKDLKDLKDLKDMLKFHRRAGGLGPADGRAPATSPSRRTRRSTTRWPTAAAC